MIVKKSKKKKSYLRRVLIISVWAILLLVIFALLSLLGLNIYLKSNETKMLDKVSILNQGSISFSKARISIFKDFPNASIILDNVKLVDSLHYSHQNTLLQANEITAVLSLKDWKSQLLEIKKVCLKNGYLRIIKDSLGYNNLLGLITKPKNEKIQDIPNQLSSKIQINSNHILFELENFEIISEDQESTLRIDAFAHTLKSELFINDRQVNGSVSIDASMRELTFKKTEGSYLKNVRLNSNFNFKIIDNKITCEEFDLSLNDQNFRTDLNFSLDQKVPTTLRLRNSFTHLDSIMPMITDNLRKSLEPYKIHGVFESDTEIVLSPGELVKISIDFELPGNDVVIKNVYLKDTRTKGKFVNRPYNFHLKEKAYLGQMYLLLSNVNFKYHNFRLSTPKAIVESFRSKKPILTSKVLVKGPASEISKWYHSQKFHFEEGDFTLNAQVHGTFNNINKLIAESHLKLNFSDLSMLYGPANTSIRIDSISLEKKIDVGVFSLISSTPLSHHPYRINGDLLNIKSLFTNLVDNTVKSNIELDAKKLGWEDFLSVFGQRNINQNYFLNTEGGRIKSLKSTLQGLYQKFDPSISIQLDSFEYFDKLMMYNFSSNFQFENENKILLKDTRFDLEQGFVQLNVDLDINHPHLTGFKFELNSSDINLIELLPAFEYFNIDILANRDSLPSDLDLEINMHGIIDDVKGLLPNSSQGVINFKSENHDNLLGSIAFLPNFDSTAINTTLQLEGKPYLFNDFFQNDKFLFQDTGRFEVSFDYVGDIGSFEDLMTKSDAKLKVTDGAVYYKDVDIVFPLNNLDLDIHQDNADFDLYMYSDILDRELNVYGYIHNLSELLIGNTGKTLTTQVDAYSPIINLIHAFDIFEPRPNSGDVIDERPIDFKMKSLAKGLFNRFNPSIHVQLDSFVIDSSFIFTDFVTGARLKDSSILILEQTNFVFHNGNIGFKANMDIGLNDDVPFRAQLYTKNLDLFRTLKSFNYFGSKSLANAEKLNGKVSLDLDLKGRLNGLSLVAPETEAILDFKIENLEIKGVSFIDKVASKLLAKRYLHDIKFAPLSNTITVTGSRIDIPQMEIMSTGVDLFVEGHIDNKNQTNIWLSVPINNLKRLPTTVVPDKRGYAASKRKVYLEITKENNGKTKSKFRLKKKKFYEQRGIPKQYQLDKKRDKKIRNKMKEKSKN